MRSRATVPAMSAARVIKVLSAALTVALITTAAPIVAAAPGSAPAPWHAAAPRTVPGEVVVTFRDGASASLARAVLRAGGATDVARAGRGSSYTARVGVGRVDAAIERYLATPGVRSAEPNRVALPALVPSDPRFEEQWALDNQGQSHRITDYGLRGKRQSGSPNSDVNAPEAWDVTTGSDEVVIAVIDSGVDIDHPDLAQSMWVNELEDAGTPGVDDDGNGYVDDVHGYDLQHDDPDPSPSAKDQHGTHVAGIIGAEHDGAGVVGICPGCRIMGLRFDFTVGQELEAIQYAIDNGADIINMSYGSPVWSPGERAAIEARRRRRDPHRGLGRELEPGQRHLDPAARTRRTSPLLSRVLRPADDPHGGGERRPRPVRHDLAVRPSRTSRGGVARSRAGGTTRSTSRRRASTSSARW